MVGVRSSTDAWGHDMHGNAAGWTRSDCGADGKEVRRGSWRERPKLCRSVRR